MGDILFLLPRCYEDRRKLKTIAELDPGERGVTVGVVKHADYTSGRNGKRYFKAVIADRSGSIAATYFHAGPWLKARFTVGKRLVLSGEIRASMTGREMAHPEIEPAEDIESSSVHFNRIVPIYPGFERGDQRSFREIAARVSESYARHLEEPLPESLRKRLKLMTLPEALRSIHFPPEDSDLGQLDAHLSPAHRRLAFDELFFLQLGVGLKRQGVKAEKGIAFNVSPERLERARGALPFQLTGAQRRVIEELSLDMARPEPMNRLVQGDVGSGKTAVALVAALLALEDGYQVAVMAPTEILAEQHDRNFRRLLEPLGYRVGLISAAGTAKQKREVREAVARGEIRLAVGTHALIQGDVAFERLGLAVIDEQHRFGVLQRHTLMSKGLKPDVLVMTATPIPRTLAMTLYGDLDVSIIDELPPGRTPVTTRVFSEQHRARVYESVATEIAKGHQAYVVYPLVEESEKLDLEDATRGAEKLQQVFPQARVGLLHGRMKPEEKDAVMEAFRERQHPRPRVHHRGGGGRGRAQRLRHGHRVRRALRPLAAPPAPRPGGARRGHQPLLPRGQPRPLLGVHRAARGHGAQQRRLRHRREGSGDPRARRVPRHAAERPARARRRQPRAGWRSALARPGRGPAHPREGSAACGRQSIRGW